MAEQTEQVYEWDVARIGDESPEYVYEVTRENIADYCRAVRYENPIYVNDGAAREAGLPGAVAPPTMMYTYAPQRRSAVIEAQGLIAPEQSQTNARSTPFVSTKVHFQGAYVQPGDTISSITRVSEKFERRRQQVHHLPRLSHQPARRASGGVRLRLPLGVRRRGEGGRLTARPTPTSTPSARSPAVSWRAPRR